HGEPAGLDGCLEFATDLFDPDSARDIARRFVRLTAALAEAPDSPIGSAPLLDPDESRRLLLEYNDTAHAVPELTFPQLFETQVRQQPHATALICGELSLSYLQLNQHANRLAHGLIAQGIGPEDLVALALPRGIEMIISFVRSEEHTD